MTKISALRARVRLNLRKAYFVRKAYYPPCVLIYPDDNLSK